MKTAIVIGVGPERGLGAQLCKRFAAEGLKVIVAGRTKSALQAVVDDIGGRHDRALVGMASVAVEAQEQGHIRLFLDAGDRPLRDAKIVWIVHPTEDCRRRFAPA